MKWGSAGGGHQAGPPAQLQELLPWLLALLGGIQTRVPRAHRQGQGTDWWPRLILFLGRLHLHRATQGLSPWLPLLPKFP